MEAVVPPVFRHSSAPAFDATSFEAAVRPSRIVCESVDSIASIAREWDALADVLGASPFLHPGWFETWLERFGRGKPLLIAARRDGRLAGVLPLERGLGVLRSASNWHSPVFAPLAEDEEVLAALVSAALEARAGRLNLDLLDAAGPALAAFRDGADAARRRIYVKERARPPYVDIEGDWAGYEQGLARKRRKELRRCRRRLEELGTVEFACSGGGTRLEELLDEGFAVEGSGWKTAAGSSLESDPNTQRFYREIARWADARGWLALAFLRVDGRAVAFDFCIEAHGVAYALKGGYDPEFARYSPGALLTGDQIARAFEIGLRRYELLGTDDPYKLVWSHGTHERVQLQAFPRTPAGFTRRVVHTDGRRLAKRAKRALTRG